jgi:signal transduction histidine kinase
MRGLARQAAQTESPEEALADVALLLPEFDSGVALFTSDGALLAASGPRELWQLLSPNLMTAAQQEISRDDTAFFFTPFDGAGSEERTLVVAGRAGEFTAAGAFSPTAVVRRALSRFFSGGESAAIFVVAADGEFLYRAGPVPSLDADPLRHPGIAGALRGEGGTTYVAEEEGEHVVAFSPIAPVGWALVIEEPWQTVTDPLLRTTEWTPLILVPVLLIALIGLGFSARQIVQPLQALEQRATALAWGDFEAIEEPVGGIAEIQRLQSELIHMAHKVQSAQESLRGYLGAVTAGQEDERRRLARELHDETIQSLIALNQRIQLVQLSLQDPQHGNQLEDMQQMVSELIANLRRQIHALRPIYLEDLGLAPALEMLAQEMSKSENVSASFHGGGRVRRLRPEVELALFRIAQEALNNVVRHAAAASAAVRLAFEPQAVTLAVHDDGRGFVVPDSPAEMAPQGHFGLLGMHERAELIGATLTIRSEPGTGTHLTVEVPV